MRQEKWWQEDSNADVLDLYQFVNEWHIMNGLEEDCEFSQFWELDLTSFELWETKWLAECQAALDEANQDYCNNYEMMQYIGVTTCDSYYCLTVEDDGFSTEHTSCLEELFDADEWAEVRDD